MLGNQSIEFIEADPAVNIIIDTNRRGGGAVTQAVNRFQWKAAVSRSLMIIDSLEMTADDRELILTHCKKSKTKHNRNQKAKCR